MGAILQSPYLNHPPGAASSDCVDRVDAGATIVVEVIMVVGVVAVGVVDRGILRQAF